SLDDEEDTRSSHEYLNDLEEEYQARALLKKSKRFFKKGTQRFSSAKANDQTECHKCGKKGHLQETTGQKLQPTKDFEAKYNKVKAKLALLSSSSTASKASMVKNKGYSHLSHKETQLILQLLSLTLQATDYDLADESSVCSVPLPSLKKLVDVEPISGPKNIKSILRSKSTFKVEALKDVTINEPFSALAKANKSSSASKFHSAPAEGKINLRNPQHVFKKCKACGSPNHITTDHYDIEGFKRDEALQAKKAKALKSTRAKSSNGNKSKTPTK
nr:retrovirus-related Pol polyprotein from transposon TNT 1-94 [Tanacetum cinerariifolium]